MQDFMLSNGAFLNESRCFSESAEADVFGLSSGMGFSAHDSGLSAGGISSAHSLGFMLRLASRGGVYLAGGRRYVAAAALTAVIGLAVPAGHALDVVSAVSSGLTVDSGANAGNNPMYVYIDGTAVDTTIGDGGEQYVYSGGVASDTTISSGAQIIGDGGVASYTTITGGSQLILPGGVASDTTISAGGQYINDGGVARATIITGGWQYIYSAGVASATIISDGGGQTIYNSGVASDTTISSGGWQIIIDGGVASATSVGAGGILLSDSGGSVVNITNPVEGILQGYGSISGDVTIADGGLLAPARANYPESTDAYGSMTIAGNLTLSPGAIYQTRVDSLGNHDAVIVTGTANVEGAIFSHVTVTGANGDDFANTRAMVMSAGGGVTGTFGSVTTTLGFFDIGLDYSIPNEIWFGFARSLGFTDYGHTYNQNSVAGGLSSLETLAPSNALIQALLGLNADEVTRVYDQLSGEMHPSLAGGLMLLDRDFSRWILDRAGRKSLAGSILAAQAPSFAAARGFASIHPRALESRFENSVWADVGYARQGIDGDGNAGRFTLKGPELTLGYDHAAPSGWLGGLAFRYADRDMDVKSRLSEADVDSYSAALYGGFQTAFGPGAARLVLGGAYSRHEIEGRRGVVIGTNSQRLRSDYHANSYQLFMEGAYAVPVGMVWLEPFAELGWTSLRVPGFVETGGNAALRSHSYSRNNLSHLLGLRLVLPDLCRVNLEAQAGWRHTYGTLDKASPFSFVEGGGRFGIKGSTLNRDEAVLDLRASYQVRDNLRIGLEANAAVGRRGTNVRGGAFVALEW